MLTYIRDYAITFVAFFLVDLVWLAFIARKLYQSNIGHLMATNVNWVAAILFYLLFIAGLLFFVIHPAIAENSIKQAFIIGAFFGFITYATYDLTNLATLKDWPVFITVVDLIWGSTLCALTSGLSYFVIQKLN